VDTAAETVYAESASVYVFDPRPSELLLLVDGSPWPPAEKATKEYR